MGSIYIKWLIIIAYVVNAFLLFLNGDVRGGWISGLFAVANYLIFS